MDTLVMSCNPYQNGDVIIFNFSSGPDAAIRRQEYSEIVDEPNEATQTAQIDGMVDAIEYKQLTVDAI